jgi:hypothetical protein
MAAPGACGVARVDDVYVVWRKQTACALDRLTAAVAGGPHVHCEMVFAVAPLAQARERSLLAVASIYPRGVYASDLCTDKFYGVSGDRDPGDWQWTCMNVTRWFPTAADRMDLWQWSAAKVGACGYAVGAAAAFAAPCGGGGVFYGSDVADKPSYLCSELVADALFRAARDERPEAAPALAGLAARCKASMFARGGTNKVSPQALLDFIEAEGRSHTVSRMDLLLSISAGATVPWS